MATVIIDRRNFMGWEKKLLKLTEPILETLDVSHRTEHSLKVYRNCEKIAKEYKGVNLGVLYAASLLHDIGKVVKEIKEHGPDSAKLAKKYLREVGFPEKDVALVLECILKHDDFIWVDDHSNDKPISLEAKIFQDADRIESLGATGVARNFMWSGKYGKIIYNEKVDWKDNVIYADNVSSVHTLHFELQLYEHFNTRTAKKIAKERVDFMRLFIKQILKEWRK